MNSEVWAVIAGIAVAVLIQMGIVIFSAGKLWQGFKDLRSTVNRLPCQRGTPDDCPEDKGGKARK